MSTDPDEARERCAACQGWVWNPEIGDYEDACAASCQIDREIAARGRAPSHTDLMISPEAIAALPDSYWDAAVGDPYEPVKWNPRHDYTIHPARVRTVITKLRAGEPCPEAADVIAALVHRHGVAWKTVSAMGDIVKETHPEHRPDPYHNESYLVRKCDFCSRPYTGPAVYCSFICAVSDC